MNSPVSQETIKKAVVLGRGLAAEFARSESRKITKSNCWYYQLIDLNKFLLVVDPDAIAKEQTAAFMHSVILQTSPIALLISQTSNILLETSRVLLQK